ncbi:MAG: 5'-3' exonuclease H3TH domain-containing protein [Atribacterota bacterium]
MDRGVLSINRPVEPKKSASNHREPPPIVLLLDGHSLAYRAFYALPPLTTSAGKPTGAILGFANMVLHLIEEYHPSSLVVTFDAPGRTFRHDLEKEYKAQRKPIPDPLQEQFPGIKDLLSLMGLRWVEQPGYEGDDLIGTLLKKLPLDQLAGIVSSDLDLLQLLDEKTFLLQPIKGVTILKTIDLTVLEKELGLTPSQVVDFIALSGDPSDNIPGVPGIGEKTATRLLRQYTSWQGIRDHLADLPPSLQKTVMEH